MAYPMLRGIYLKGKLVCLLKYNKIFIMRHEGIRLLDFGIIELLHLPVTAQARLQIAIAIIYQ